MKIRIFAVILLLISGLLGYGVYVSNFSGHGKLSNYPFKLGLDLNGGTHLTYDIDTSKVGSDERDSVNALREVIERRVNLFGVSEPIVQTEVSSVGSSAKYRLLVELPGVTDVNEAVKQIGKTPLLEFKILKQGEIEKITATTSQITIAESFIDTGLTGELLKRATVQFNQNTNEPTVALEFNDKGKDLFAKITKENVGNVVAIFLDGEAISMPVVREEIRDGRAEISGSFTVKEAKELVKDLNYGALPLPINLVSTETIGPTLGKSVLDSSIKAGIIAFIVVSIFLLVWYRLPGLVAIVALTMYVIFNLVLFKLIPVTLTAAGIAGFILSIGMAVDANILIFERTKEELRKGKSLKDSIKEGFERAWLSIRDSNSSSIITAVILYYFASTPVIKGFALVFGLGVLVSMFTAITATRTMLYALPKIEREGWKKLFKSGIFN